MKRSTFLLVLFFTLSFELYSQDIPSKIPIEVDLGVNGIMLADTSNVKRFVNISEEAFMELLYLYFPPHINVVNKDSTELLVLIFHPGSDNYSFNEFKVARVTDTFTAKYIVLSQVKKFVTYKNVFLGMSIDEIKNIFGNNYKEETNGLNIIINYNLSEENSNCIAKQFLKFYGMPIYYGSYSFHENQLIKIEFGFSYP